MKEQTPLTAFGPLSAAKLKSAAHSHHSLMTLLVGVPNLLMPDKNKQSWPPLRTLLPL